MILPSNQKLFFVFSKGIGVVTLCVLNSEFRLFLASLTLKEEEINEERKTWWEGQVIKSPEVLVEDRPYNDRFPTAKAISIGGQNRPF